MVSEQQLLVGLKGFETINPSEVAPFYITLENIGNRDIYKVNIEEEIPKFIELRLEDKVINGQKKGENKKINIVIDKITPKEKKVLKYFIVTNEIPKKDFEEIHLVTRVNYTTAGKTRTQSLKKEMYLVKPKLVIENPTIRYENETEKLIINFWARNDSYNKISDLKLGVDILNYRKTKTRVFVDTKFNFQYKDKFDNEYSIKQNVSATLPLTEIKKFQEITKPKLLQGEEIQLGNYIKVDLDPLTYGKFSCELNYLVKGTRIPTKLIIEPPPQDLETV
jgi:hypothetical protein